MKHILLLISLLLSVSAFGAATQIRSSAGNEMVVNSDGSINIMGGGGSTTYLPIYPIYEVTIGSNNYFGIYPSGAGSDGYLKAADWSIFNGKQSTIASYSSPAHKFFTSYAAGVFTDTHPSCADLSDATLCNASSVPASQISGILASASGGTGTATYAKGDTLYASAANVLSKLNIGTQIQVHAVLSNGVPGYLDPVNPSTGACLYDEFQGTGLTTGGAYLADTNWVAVTSGTAAAITGISSDATSSSPGLTGFTTGSTTTGFAGIRKSLNTLLGGGAMQTEFVTKFLLLSNATDTFRSRFGWTDTNAAADAINAVYWVYDPSATFTCTGVVTNGSANVSGLGGCVGVVDDTSIQNGQTITGTNIQASTLVSSVNAGAGTMVMSKTATPSSGTVTLTFTYSDYWTAKAINTSTKTVQVTSSAVTANTFYRLGINVNPAASSVAYNIAGSTVATLVTNIPTATQLGSEAVIIKTAGGAAMTMDIDYFKQCFIPTVAR